MAALATISDLAARGVTVSADETEAVNVFLDVASEMVRSAADSPISQTTSTVTLTGDDSQWLRLPGGPVSAVQSVALDGVTVTDYRLSDGRLWRSCGWSADAGPSAVTVTYTHGMAAVPADIVDLVCRLAGQELIALRDGESASRPLKTERIGDYSAGYDTDAWSGTMTLTDWQRERLAARFGAGAQGVRSR